MNISKIKPVSEKHVLILRSIKEVEERFDNCHLKRGDYFLQDGRGFDVPYPQSEYFMSEFTPVEGEISQRVVQEGAEESYILPDYIVQHNSTVSMIEQPHYSFTPDFKPISNGLLRICQHLLSSLRDIYPFQDVVFCFVPPSTESCVETAVALMNEILSGKVQWPEMKLSLKRSSKNMEAIAKRYSEELDRDFHIQKKNDMILVHFQTSLEVTINEVSLEETINEVSLIGTINEVSLEETIKHSILSISPGVRELYETQKNEIYAIEHKINNREIDPIEGLGMLTKCLFG